MSVVSLSECIFRYMVNLSCELVQDHIDDLRDRRIFCFGGGKCFLRFVSNTKEINIAGIIDNYLSKETDKLACDNGSTPVT